MPTSYGSYPPLIAPPMAIPAILSYLRLSPMEALKADTYKNTPIVPSLVLETMRVGRTNVDGREVDGEARRRVLKGSGDSTQVGRKHEDVERRHDGETGAAGGEEQRRDEVESSENQTLHSRGAVVVSRQRMAVNEESSADISNFELSREWELEWKRCIGVEKYVPQYGFLTGIGQTDIGLVDLGTPPGGFEGGIGSDGSHNHSVQGSIVKPVEAFRPGSLEGDWEGRLVVRSSLSSCSPPSHTIPVNKPRSMFLHSLILLHSSIIDMVLTISYLERPFCF